MKVITDFLPPEKIAVGVSTCRFGDWREYADLLFWTCRVNRSKYRAVLDRLDWVELDIRTKGLWANPSSELPLLLYSLAVYDQEERARHLIAKHADEIEVIDPIIAGISPDSAITVYRRGGRVNLAGRNDSAWGLQAWAVSRIAECDKPSAIAIVESNTQHIVTHLRSLETTGWGELPVFLQTLDNLEPELLRKFFCAVDAKSTEERWAERLRKGTKQVRREVRKILAFAEKYGEGEIQLLAKKLSAFRRR